MHADTVGQRLLVVDDEPFNLEIITEYFEGSGLEIDTAEDGEIAWSRLDSGRRYAAVLLDRMMPVLDGMGLLLRMKSDGRFREIPVIMQTAAGNPDQVREGLAAGAYYYLVKPYERDSLLTIVRGALADASARNDLRRKLADHASALQLMGSGSFSFRTVDEAAILAAFIAQACPQPEAAALTLSELFVNAVEHGNLGISYEEKSQLRREERWDEEVACRLALDANRGKRVRVGLARGDDELSIRIIDEGNGFDWQRYLEFDPARAFDPNGRGIALARMSGAATIEYQGVGNTVVVRMSCTDISAT
jgi:CheY-like chemotaxis protein/anti-sigma regulatory factor (Ser/Thr protein kinase)